MEKSGNFAAFAAAQEVRAAARGPCGRTFSPRAAPKGDPQKHTCVREDFPIDTKHQKVADLWVERCW
jgi:hypothetical protein